jgi:hypothetical protein
MTMTMNTNDQIQTIELSDLEYVTGGGKWSKLWDGVQAVGKFIGDAAPAIGKKALEAAKWVGIPAGLGAGAAWVQHQSD